jgi:hypothetical protein
LQALCFLVWHQEILLGTRHCLSPSLRISPAYPCVPYGENIGFYATGPEIASTYAKATVDRSPWIWFAMTSSFPCDLCVPARGRSCRFYRNCAFSRH